jgi:hypothetical protein
MMRGLVTLAMLTMLTVLSGKRRVHAQRPRPERQYSQRHQQTLRSAMNSMKTISRGSWIGLWK